MLLQPLQEHDGLQSDVKNLLPRVKHSLVGVKWNDVPESITQAHSSFARLTLACLQMNKSSSSLVAMVEVLFSSDIFLGSTSSTIPLSFLRC